MNSRRPPLLVTGVPRSGTTWLARLLATAPHTALAGREPMNPRGKQYALAGSVDGWTRLTSPTARQQRVLRLTYRGWNPRTYGRYGRHQWRGPLPRTRLVVKDPFAMLSTPAIVAVTGARPVQVYRHPGAVFASYQRMGWRPDLPEITPLVPAIAERRPEVARLWDLGPESLTPAQQMALFWSVLQQLVIDDLAQAPATVLVAHEQFAAGGIDAVSALFRELELTLTEETEREMSGGTSPTAPTTGNELHRLQRRPADVAQSWRKNLAAEEIDEIERVAAPMIAELESRCLTW